MKVLIPEKFNKAGIAVLEDAGYEVTFKPDTTPEELVEMIPEYDALIVRSATTVTREVIEAGTKLKIIGRAGVGVDNIDREAATERGIIVCNAPLSNVVSAAEQTMALMLATLTLHGITPGVRLMADNPDIVYSTFLSLILANLLIIPTAIITVRGFGKLIKFPTAILLSIIVICSLLGVYLPRSNMFDVWMALLIGVIAFLMRFADFPVAPFLIGYVLSAQLEYRLGQAVIYKGDMPLTEYLFSAPVALVLFAVSACLLLAPMLRPLWASRRK